MITSSAAVGMAAGFQLPARDQLPSTGLAQLSGVPACAVHAAAKTTAAEYMVDFIFSLPV
jgi:hypothetical protein